MKKIFSDNKRLFLFFLTLSLLFYGNSIQNGFCFDDSYVTVTNKPVPGKKFTPNNTLVAEGIKGIPKIWQSRYGHGFGTAYDYRPVVLTLFAIEYTAFGSSAPINHFISILLYSLVAFYLFMILVKCLHPYPYRDFFSLVCTILFIAHPIHTEVVNNIKCTDELLALLFGLLTTYNILKYYEVKHIRFLVFSGIFILLALYSKLTSAIFVVIIPLVMFFFFKLEKKQIIFSFLGLLVFYVIHNLIRNSILSEKEIRYVFHFENPLYTETVSFFTKVLFALKSLGIYIKLLFVAYPLRYYYGSAMLTTDLNLADFEIILSLLFVSAAGYFCYRTKNKIAFFGLLLFLLSIAPLINFIQPVAGIIGERLCFTASIGFIIFIVSVLFTFYKTIPSHITGQLFTKKPLVYLSVILLVFLFYTWNRNSVWKDEMTLFEHDAPYLEKSAGANNLLANKYFDMLYTGNSKYTQKELVDNCMHYYGLAIVDDSSVYSAFNNIGVVIFSYMGQYENALNYFIRATKINTNYPQANENIANCYDRLGNQEKAIKYYRIAISQNSGQLKSYIQITKILQRQKRYKELAKLFEICDKLFPNDYSLTIERGNYYYQTHQYELAIQKFEQAYRSKRTKDLALSLYNTYSVLHDNEKMALFKSELDAFSK